MAGTLPPLNSVRTFSVASKHLNFTRAAEELGVTQGAISKQILLLEDFVGARLFERKRGGLILTDEGLVLQRSLSPAFADIQTVFERLSRRQPYSNVIRLATVASFASNFLIPRLADFRANFPHIELEIVTSHRVIDLEKEEIDLCIRFGSGDWHGLISEELAKGDLVPVCSPVVFTALDGDDLTAHLKTMRRLRVFTNNEWDQWAIKAGIDLSDAAPPMIAEHFVVAIQAVLKDGSCALLPEILIRDHLVDGSLVSFSNIRIEWPRTFHFAHLANADTQPDMANVIVWFKKQVTESLTKALV